tara:strand:+ start:5420 stop:5662 length:243 start_codon:yes stop_codon:yes gene_type:complete
MKNRTLNELRQVKDTVYNNPKNKNLTEVEQNLLNDLNYQAQLAMMLEEKLKARKAPYSTEAVYSFSIEELESLLEMWAGK